MARTRNGIMAPDRPLTEREQRLVRAKAKGYSTAKAMKIAGYRPTGAHGQIINRPVVQSALTAALAKQGISLSKIVKPIGDALKATLHSSFMGQLRKSDLPDHKTRLEAAELGISLHGGLPKQVELPPAPQEPLTVVVESADGSRVALRMGGPASDTEAVRPARQPTTPASRQADELKIILDSADRS